VIESRVRVVVGIPELLFKPLAFFSVIWEIVV
jgi:hypothetical protein